MKKAILALVTMTILASSCMEMSSSIPTSKNELVVAARPVWMSQETKAPVIGTTFPTTIPFTLTSYSSTLSSTFFTDIPFSYSSTDNGWKATAGKYWPHSGTLDFLAYSAPGLSPTVTHTSPNATSGITSFVTGDNRTVQADIMFGAAAGCAYSETVLPTLNFKHALTLVTFTALCPNASYDGTSGITVESITLANAKYGGTCAVTRSGSNISNISWSTTSNAYNGASVPGISSQGLTTTAVPVGDGIMLPPQSAVNFTVNYKVWSGGTGTDRSYTYTCSGSWEMGMRHVYRLEISANEVIVKAEVEDWADTTKDWFYADGNVVRNAGVDFTLASGQPVFWREGTTGAYEQLTYYSGSYGTSVTYESTDYFVTVTKSGSAWLVTYVSKDRVEYEYRLYIEKSGDKVLYGLPFYVYTYLQRRERTWTSGVASAWSEWANQGKMEHLTWDISGSIYPTISETGEVDLVNMPPTEHDATFSTSWTSYLGGREVTLSGSVVVTIAETVRYGSFGGLNISPAPLYHNGTTFEIKDLDWQHPLSPDPFVYGKSAGSYYFNFIELGSYFSSQGNSFDSSSGDIDNNGNKITYEGFNNWRMPTQGEWTMIFNGTGRTGATVNGTSGVFNTAVHIIGTYVAGCETATGFLVFPDDKVITGAALARVNVASNNAGWTAITLSELKVYIAQGAVFLPCCGENDKGTWRYMWDAQPMIGMWSATQSGSWTAYDLMGRGDQGWAYTTRTDQKTDYWFVTRLVRDITP